MLTTRFTPPPARRDLVSRLRLIRLLDAGVKCKLTLISAPQGSGKTTLLSEWAARAALPVGWLAIEEDDNDPVAFVRHLVAALGRSAPGLGLSTLSSLDTAALPLIEPALALLLNDVTALPGRFVLILDDYHLIESPAVHKAMIYLLTHLPEQLRLIVASRSDPPLSLARLRSQGELAEIRVGDLRFNAEETAAFFRQAARVTLTPGAVRALEAHTEGWIAGLQLAALSVSRGEEVPDLLAASPGGGRYVMDFLAEEVLARQPEAVQGFLLETSILDQMSGPVCEAVTAYAAALGGGQTALEALDRANLFVVALDDRRSRYRYHQLFHDFLRERLRRTMPERIPELHRAAAEWYTAHAMSAEALHHALDASYHPTITALIEDAGWTIRDRKMAARLLDWLDRMPDALRQASPRLCLLHAWTLIFLGHLDRFALIEARLRSAERSRSGTEALPAIKATVALLRGDAARTIALSRQALNSLDERFGTLRGIAALNLGQAYRVAGDLEQASGAFSEAIAINRAVGNMRLVLVALCQLAHLQMLRGQLHQAARAFRQVLQVAQEQEESASAVVVGLSHAGLSAILLEWNALDEAAEHAAAAAALGKQMAEAQLEIDGVMALADIAQARADDASARRHLEEVDRLLKSPNLSPTVSSQIEARKAGFWLRRGDFAAVVRWARECGLNADDPPTLNRFLELLTLSRAMMVNEEVESASRLLGSIRASLERTGHIWGLIETLLLQALAARDVPTAEEALREALALAAPEHYLRTFLDKGPPLAALLRRLTPSAADGYDSTYIARLLAAFGDQRPAALSEREFEILKHIAAGMSNREIADRLIVTVETVKWHVKNIYRKLNVTTRTQALARAKRLELL